MLVLHHKTNEDSIVVMCDQQKLKVPVSKTNSFPGKDGQERARPQRAHEARQVEAEGEEEHYADDCRPRRGDHDGRSG